MPEGVYAGAGRIAREIKAPQNYLGKLLQVLAREGLLVSQKGLGGGFRLARDPNEITLYDVVEPFEHISRWSGCLLGHRECSDEAACGIHHQWKRVRHGYFRLLTRTTIADLLAKGELKMNLA
jgi:Rrf2 family protein